MTLKDLQEEGGRKITDKFFNVARDNEQRIWTLPKEFTGTEEELQSFLKSQTSLAYELGKKETLDMVLKEIEGELEKNDKNGGRTMYELGAKDALDSLKQKLLQVNPREEI